MTFTAFVVAGSIPLLSYMTDLGDAAFAVAAMLTVLALFVVGASRAAVTDGTWWRSGLEMTIVGVAAATVAYVVGAAVAPLAT